LAPYGESVILTGAIKIHIKVVYVFYPADIFHFPSFGCHLVPQLGSLRQKCGPDRCDQNSHKSRLCFFTQQTLSIFMPLVVTWGPSLDPCGKSVILTGAVQIHIKVVRAFLPSRHFPCSFLWLSLVVPNLDPCCKSVILTGAIKIHIKIVYVFLPIKHFPFSVLWLSPGAPTWILAAKVWS
jgi:hypothetical protein